MPHEIRRLLRAFAKEAWFIDPRKGEQIVAMLEFRALNGPRDEPWRGAPGHLISGPADPPDYQAMLDSVAADRNRGRGGNGSGTIAVLPLHGPIVPRSSAIEDVSAQAAQLDMFQRQFARAAADPEIKAIVIDVDSPGGSVSLVPETAAMIRGAHNPDRPIVAVANTLAASAAYWIATAADELVVSPSGEVGSIGVYMMHEDVSQALEAKGIAVTFISAGPRKVEGNPFEPLGAEARAALQQNVEHFYSMFTKDVAKFRRVPVARVRADPEKADKHFGGGRVYPASRAVELGMADRVETLDAVLARLQRRR